MKLLRTVPGIGTLITMEMLVELQNVERFQRAEELASYIGLTPSEFFTGQYVRQGRMTMRLKYNKLKSMKGAKRAIIAIARNLVIRIRKMLLGHEPYVVGVC